MLPGAWTGWPCETPSCQAHAYVGTIQKPPFGANQLHHHTTSLARIALLRRQAALQLVLVLVEGHELLLETLALADGLDKVVCARAVLQGVIGHGLPVIEDHGGERLAGGGSAQLACEAKRLCHRQMRLDLHPTGNGWGNLKFRARATEQT